VSYSGTHILDTSVLLYFLLVKQVGLLAELIGSPLQVPLAVYDPDDRAHSGSQRPELLSEMRQAIRHYGNREPSERNSELLRQVSLVDALFDAGTLTTVAMDGKERVLAARLQDKDHHKFGLKVPLGPGEAACVAISLKRDWCIVTDDSDAIRAMKQLQGDRAFSYDRIRRLLMRAATEGRVSQQQANEIHTDMTDLGFWDSVLPFPE